MAGQKGLRATKPLHVMCDDLRYQNFEAGTQRVPDNAAVSGEDSLIYTPVPHDTTDHFDLEISGGWPLSINRAVVRARLRDTNLFTTTINVDYRTSVIVISSKALEAWTAIFRTVAFSIEGLVRNSRVLKGNGISFPYGPSEMLRAMAYSNLFR